jgi:hypothetical protein
VLRSDCTLIVLVRGPGALGSQPPAARPWYDALRMPPSPVVPSLRPSLLLPRSLLPVAVVSVTGRRCLGRQTTRCRAPRPGPYCYPFSAKTQQANSRLFAHVGQAQHTPIASVAMPRPCSTCTGRHQRFNRHTADPAARLSHAAPLCPSSQRVAACCVTTQAGLPGVLARLYG